MYPSLTVLKWPTTLYVRDDVAPITRKVDRLTKTPSRPEITMAVTAPGVYEKPSTVSGVGLVTPISSIMGAIIIKMPIAYRVEKW